MSIWIFADNNIEVKQGLEGVPVSVLRIIKRRGVSEESFADFISGKPKCTYDPFLLPNMREVCERILSICREKKRICVYGDYDADGITSTTLMVSLLKRFNENVTFYIPSRFDDGYGPNIAAFEKIAKDGAEVIITVDCGITSKNEIAYAQSLGIECIVTDHHIIREGMIPDCLNVNPHLPESNYPFKDLSGCGVAFKIAQGIERILSESGDERSKLFTKKELNQYLDLVAISTVADVVPLLDENRCLVKYGLDRINRREREGLSILLSKLKLQGIIDAGNISFIIAPNINALGRIYRADKGVELLESVGSRAELSGLADYIIGTNRERKTIQERTSAICKSELNTGKCGDYACIIYAPGAHEGVAGIVAGNLKEELNKPVCIVSPATDGSMKGTGRSIPGINLHSLFEQCADLFDRFGGHAGACGFTVKNGCLDIFRDRMQVLTKELAESDPSLFEKKIYIEKELDASEKTLEFAQSLSVLEPYGEANPVPVFSLSNAVVSEIKYLGSDGQHIKFIATGSDGISVECIAFGLASKYRGVVEKGFVDVAGELGVNEYRGKKQIQLKVVDIREA